MQNTNNTPQIPVANNTPIVNSVPVSDQQSQSQTVNEVVEDLAKVPEKKRLSRTIVIDGESFIIQPLAFGPFTELAGLLGKAIHSLKMDMGLNDAKDQKLTIGIGEIMGAFPSMATEVLSIALQIPEERVKQFRDTKAAMKAIDYVFELNPVGDLLGKATDLFQGITSI